MTLRTLVIVLVAASATIGAQKPAPVKGPLASAKSFRCSFPAYGAANWATTPPAVVSGSQEFTFQIDSIDYRRSRARIVGESGGTMLTSMLLTQTGLSVIEQTSFGNLTVTSIFSGGSEGATFRAVHSRHLGELDAAPRTSQAYGSCQLQ